MKQVKLWMIVVILFCGSPAHAEEYRNQQKAEEKTVIEVPQWMKNIRLSGYGMVQYQTTYEDKYEEEDDESSTFNLRFMRLMLDGKIGDFDWRTQIQGTNVRGAGEPTVQLLRLNDRTRDKQNYNLMDVQLDFRF